MQSWHMMPTKNSFLVYFLPLQKLLKYIVKKYMINLSTKPLYEYSIQSVFLFKKVYVNTTSFKIKLVICF